MTTSVVVKDMVSVLDAFASGSENICNAHLINFWGFSYWSIIGQVFCSMFPDRIGPVVLDRVVDPADFTSAA